MNETKKRQLLTANAVLKLADVEELVAEIIATYPSEKTSAAHPRSGLAMSLKTLGSIRKSLRNVK